MCIGEVKSFIVRAALQAPAPDNIPPEKFTWEQSRLHIEYDTQRVAGITFSQEDMATRLTFGACLENIAQASHALGITHQVNIEERRISVDFDFSGIDQTKIENALENKTRFSLFKRHTNRHPFQKQSIAHSIIASLKSQAKDLENVSITTSTDTNIIKQWAESVRIASEARFQTREAHEWFGKSLRFGSLGQETGDGLDVATLNLPPGGSLFLRFISSWNTMKILNHIKIYKLLGVIESLPIAQSSMIIAISAKNSRECQINAGQLMNRVWIWLNEQGLAVQPYYVIPDLINRSEKEGFDSQLEPWLRKTRKGVKQLLPGHDDDNNRLCIILRVGYAKKDPVRSLRLPLETVTSEEAIATTSTWR